MNSGEFDAIANPEDASRDDIRPAGQGPDDLLKRKRQPGAEEPYYQPELAGEWTPDQSQADQRQNSQRIVGNLSGVIPDGGIPYPPTKQEPQTHHHHKGSHHSQGGDEEPTAGGLSVEQPGHS